MGFFTIQVHQEDTSLLRFFSIEVRQADFLLVGSTKKIREDSLLLGSGLGTGGRHRSPPFLGYLLTVKALIEKLSFKVGQGSLSSFLLHSPLFFDSSRLVLGPWRLATPFQSLCFYCGASDIRNLPVLVRPPRRPLPEH
jgi:hypothetical protein